MASFTCETRAEAGWLGLVTTGRWGSLKAHRRVSARGRCDPSREWLSWQVMSCRRRSHPLVQCQPVSEAGRVAVWGPYDRLLRDARPLSVRLNFTQSQGQGCRARGKNKDSQQI